MASIKARRLLIVLGLLAAVVAVNLAILRYERILDEGDIVLLPLAPVDPRSLMQGDYMRLRYAVEPDIEQLTGDEADANYAILRVDDKRVGHLVRVQADAEPRASDEMAVRFQHRKGRIIIATDAFYFEEGRADHFQAARYGELRVINDGTALLSGLRDADHGAL